MFDERRYLAVLEHINQPPINDVETDAEREAVLGALMVSAVSAHQAIRQIPIRYCTEEYSLQLAGIALQTVDRELDWLLRHRQ